MLTIDKRAQEDGTLHAEWLEGTGIIFFVLEPLTEAQRDAVTKQVKQLVAAAYECGFVEGYEHRRQG